MGENSEQGAAAPDEVVDLETAVRRRIIAKDPRFQVGAYLFLYEALAYTQKKLGRDAATLEAAKRHVTGQELLEGIREYAHTAFGPLAPTVFRNWGLTASSDFGDVVFNCVDNGLLGKTPDDSLDDFANGFDFDTAFENPPEVEPQ